MRQKVAGISFQEENIILLARENDDYNLSKKELLEQYADGEKVHLYDFILVNRAKLQPEPENPHDPNAIAVYAQHPYTREWLKIGYIKAGSTGRVNTEAVYSVNIDGGPYKEINGDSVENGETGFWASIEEIAKEEAPEAPAAAPAAALRDPADSKPKKSKKTALLLCIFLGIFGAHKFYEGKPGMGILYLLTGGLLLVGWISDIFKILKYPEAF